MSTNNTIRLTIIFISLPMIYSIALSLIYFSFSAASLVPWILNTAILYGLYTRYNPARLAFVFLNSLSLLFCLFIVFLWFYELSQGRPTPRSDLYFWLIYGAVNCLVINQFQFREDLKAEFKQAVSD